MLLLNRVEPILVCDRRGRRSQEGMERLRVEEFLQRVDPYKEPV